MYSGHYENRRLDKQPTAKGVNNGKERGVRAWNIIVQYLAKLNNAFGGSNGAIFIENNGWVLSFIIEMIWNVMLE